jgi:hypothetical protein
MGCKGDLQAETDYEVYGEEIISYAEKTNLNG